MTWSTLVLRMNEPPLPATLAVLKAVSPGCVVVVDPEWTDADDLREDFYDRYVGDER